MLLPFFVFYSGFCPFAKGIVIANDDLIADHIAAFDFRFIFSKGHVGGEFIHHDQRLCVLYPFDLFGKTRAFELDGLFGICFFAFQHIEGGFFHLITFERVFVLEMIGKMEELDFRFRLWCSYYL